MPAQYDFAIIGGGIVGLATAYAIKRQNPWATLVVLEKEPQWARHQTGHNSGVIHSGIYYKPGGFKARFCRAGNHSMVAFCREHGIAFEICGKVIVATRREELPQLDRLYERGLLNNLQVKRLGARELQEIEPHVCGLGAIRVLDAGIVDYKSVCQTLATLLRDAGCGLNLQHEVTSVTQTASHVQLIAADKAFRSRYMINCAGLHSDRIATLSGVKTGLQIVPFRGEYFELRPERRHLVKHLIYPVPNPESPFLGVHYTRMIGGHVEAGPNAVLALAREGYRKTEIDFADLRDTLAFSGFRKLVRRYWKEGAQELWRSLSKRAFVRSLQQLIPAITPEDLVPAAAGIRAQALKADGSLVDDFCIISDKRCLHVCNAPSPAATASLEIGKHVAGLIEPAIAIGARNFRRGDHTRCLPRQR
jgi:L-2-hydroxyglutarate oxidase